MSQCILSHGHSRGPCSLHSTTAPCLRRIVTVGNSLHSLGILQVGLPAELLV